MKKIIKERFCPNIDWENEGDPVPEAADLSEIVAAFARKPRESTPADEVSVLSTVLGWVTSLLSDSSEENKRRVETELHKLDSECLLTTEPCDVNPCDFLVPQHFVMNPYVWQMVKVSAQERTTALEQVMLRERVECSSDLQRAGAGLVFKEDDHCITAVLGKGAFAVVCSACLSSRPNIVYALKLEATNTEKAVKNCLRQLEMQSRCDPKYVVQLFGWHLADYNNLHRNLPKLGDELVFCIMMELGDTNLEEYRVNYINDVYKPSVHGLKGEALVGAKHTAVVRLLKTYLPILLQLAQALQHCHGRGVKHRDFKTENVLYFANQKRWKLADFGIAGEGTTHSQGTMNQGTEGYQAPEAQLGLYSDKTDIYSFARVFYEVVAGKLPRKGRASLFKEDTFRHILFGTMLKDAIGQMLAIDPKDRPDASMVVGQINDLITAVDALMSTST